MMSTDTASPESLSPVLPESAAERLSVLSWRLISVGFLYPDEAWGKRFENLFKKAADCCAAAGKKRRAQLEKLRDSFAGTSREILAGDFHRLFGSGGSVSLDATVYLTENPFDQAKKAADLAGFYKAFGVEAASGNRPDSLPALFELVSYLHVKAVYAGRHRWKEKEKVTRDAIRSLTTEFLKPAVEGFVKRLGESQPGEFYLQLANLSREVVHEKI
ncbi:MAG: molecular chaperone TorD family protein [Elusimicrobia bacterium]|nr:molecular chaperone TorD family protein [Elusimicrobiota bacterium]